MLKAMVVGGPAALVYGNLARKLKEHDITVGWHVSSKDGGTEYRGVPDDCNAVLIITNIVRHRLHDRAVSDSKARGLPFARIHSQWAKAEPVLRMTGIICNQKKPPKMSAANIYQMALEYVSRSRQDGRIPGRQEIRAVLRGAYGKDVKLTNQQIDRAYNEAAARVPMHQSTSETETVKQWAMALIEDDPRLLLDTERLVKSIQENTSCGMNMAPIIRDCVALMKDRITNESKRRDSLVQAMRNKWIRDWFKRAVNGRDEWPSFSLVRKRSRELFGLVPDWDKVKPIRADVLGPWALELSSWRTVEKQAREKYEEFDEDLLELLQKGEVQGIEIPFSNCIVWMTSLDAVDEYMKTRTAPEPEDVAPEKEPEPVEPAPDVTTESDITVLLMAMEESVLKKMDKMLQLVQGKQDDLAKTVKQLSDLLSFMADQQSKIICKLAALKVHPKRSPLSRFLDDVETSKVSIQLEVSPSTDDQSGV